MATQTETTTVERTFEWTARKLREQMKARGITLRRLAIEAGEYHSNLS